MGSREIRDAALERGFAGCGIARIEALHEYGGRLEERMRLCPASTPILEPLRRYASLEKTYPWARSVIVCVTDYSAYKVPEQLHGLIGRYYLFDHKLQPATPGARRIASFEGVLDRMGIRWAKELHGVTSARMAAEKAGLGIVRSNNFFYTANGGSRTILDSWVIDRPLEWIESTPPRSCPADCRQCITACPTNALQGPHCMDASKCVTLLTWGSRDLPSPEACSAAGSWIYGCDLCQDACPNNRDLRPGDVDYPGLDEFARAFTLSGLLSMDDATVKEILLPRFWFIQPDKFWLWKVNALRAMVNAFRPEYAECIAMAENDGNEKVREMAARVRAGLAAAGRKCVDRTSAGSVHT